VIDVPTAATAYIARFEKKDKSDNSADIEALRAESARMDKERREMRAEMARMRKEMSASSNPGDEKKLTVEERLSELEDLHKKKLISDVEYEQKRKEILNDI